MRNTLLGCLAATLILIIPTTYAMNDAEIPAAPQGLSALTQVEKLYVNEYKIHPKTQEKILTIPLKDNEDIHKLTALRFIEWARDNPNGVAVLPTGRFAKDFALELAYYKKHWNSYFVKRERRHLNIKSEDFPDTSNLKLVQNFDPFISSYQTEKETPPSFSLSKLFNDSETFKKSDKNEYLSFVNEYYTPVLQLKSENILIMDIARTGLLNLETQKTVFPDKAQINQVIQQYTQHQDPLLSPLQKAKLDEVSLALSQFEEKIQSWGGVGFYYDTLNSDCHIGYNPVGTSHDSGTRILNVNQKAVISIGLGTITQNKDAIIIIAASGKSKARAVRTALRAENHPSIPATALYSMGQARFYISDDAMEKLK